MGERIELRALVIRGPARDYVLEFHGGVNVIAGPVLTGKSTALRLIDYAFGSRRPPEIPELAACTAVRLECIVGGEVLTIERSLKAPSAPALIFGGSLRDLAAGKLKALPVAPRHSKDQNSISSEILRRLGLSGVSVKEAPKQEASTLSAFSLRDLLTLVYVDQTRISDDRSAFFEREPHKAIKWRAGFDILHDLLDNGATRLAEALELAQSEEAAISRHLASAQEFLDDASVPSADEIKKQLQLLETSRAELSERQERVQLSAQQELGDNMTLVRRRRELSVEASGNEARQRELERTLTQLGRLRVQYERERSQLEFLDEADRLIGSLPVVRCPECLQETVSWSSEVVSTDKQSCRLCHRDLQPTLESVSVEARLRATKRRITDLEKYLAQLQGSRQALEADAERLNADLREVTALLEQVSQTSLLPSHQLLADVSASLGLVERRQSAYREQLFLRERAEGQGSALLAVRERIRRLSAQLAELLAKAPSADAVVEALAEYFRANLKALRFPYLDGVGIGASDYLPIVRNARYGAVSSKGAISLIVTAWHLALLDLAFHDGSRHPMLLVLDSPLSHVGRDSSDPAFKDQQMVDAFYERLKDLHDAHAGDCQIILCDNHPPFIEASMVCAQFTRDATSGRVGLIEDLGLLQGEEPTLDGANHIDIVADDESAD